MTRPRLLDLFRGQGGAAAGYIAAGFDVTGVDKYDTGRRYPGTALVGDALEYLEAHGAEFDVIHASPPCQAYSRATAGNPAARSRHTRLIAATRDLLEDTGRPWVLENVEQARSELRTPLLLCGRMFDLRAVDEDGHPLVLDRHRLFESNVLLWAPAHPTHGDETVAGVYRGARLSSKQGATPADDRYAARYLRRGGYVPRSRRVRQTLMGGVDWMTDNGLAEAIPPVYATHLGRQLYDVAMRERFGSPEQLEAERRPIVTAEPHR